MIRGCLLTCFRKHRQQLAVGITCLDRQGAIRVDHRLWHIQLIVIQKKRCHCFFSRLNGGFVKFTLPTFLTGIGQPPGQLCQRGDVIHLPPISALQAEHAIQLGREIQRLKRGFIQVVRHTVVFIKDCQPHKPTLFTFKLKTGKALFTQRLFIQ